MTSRNVSSYSTVSILFEILIYCISFCWIPILQPSFVIATSTLDKRYYTAAFRTDRPIDEMFSLMGDPVGSAVVFFHKVKEQRPLSLVRAVALTDLQASNLEGIREKTVCQARVLDKWWPCLVVEIEECKT